MVACSWQGVWAAYIIPRLTRVIWQRKSGHSPAVITFSLWSLACLGPHECPALLLASLLQYCPLIGWAKSQPPLLTPDVWMGWRLWENKHLFPQLKRLSSISQWEGLNYILKQRRGSDMRWHLILSFFPCCRLTDGHQLSVSVQI